MTSAAQGRCVYSAPSGTLAQVIEYGPCETVVGNEFIDYQYST